jgi:Protein of unknown function (DUF4245)
MIGALLILLVPMIGWVVLSRPSGHGTVQVVDTRPDIREAKAQARFPVLVPAGLPARWRPTSSRVVRDDAGRVVFRIGYVTPADKWAGLVEGDKPSLLADEIGPDRKPTGSVDAAGTRWTRYPGRRGGEQSLVRTAGGTTYLITGTAKLDELRKLAEALR